jgi:uncharacterized membrane protein
MKFLKTTLLSGLSILLPLMLLWIGIKEIGGLLVMMATPIADMLPGQHFEKLTAPGVVAAILIVCTAFIMGLTARFSSLRGVGRNIENSILFNIPMYRMLKTISGALVDSSTSDVDAAIIRDGSGGGDPCYVMEKHKDGRATVLVPWSPASFAGSIKIVQQSNLEMLNCTVDEYSRSLSQMGVGVEECMASPPVQDS